MKENNKKRIAIAVIQFLIFIAFTVMVKTTDVRPIGIMDDDVGMSLINEAVRNKLPYNDLYYKISELLGFVSLGVVGIFGLIGLIQLISRKSLKKVDFQIIGLGFFYVVVLGFYVLFDKIVINYRPVLEDGQLAASYPSSHTMLSVCVMVTAMMNFSRLLKNKKGLKFAVNFVCFVVMVGLVVTRTLSGVHWISDIIGGLLLSTALILMYHTAMKIIEAKKLNKKKQ